MADLGAGNVLARLTYARAKHLIETVGKRKELKIIFWLNQTIEPVKQKLPTPACLGARSPNLGKHSDQSDS